MSQSNVRRCVILGGGGHAAVLIDCLIAAYHEPPAAILDSNQLQHGSRLLGVPIIGGDEQLERCAQLNFGCFVVGIGSIAHTDLRSGLFQSGLSHGLMPLNVIHPSAVVSSFAQIGDGAQILPRAVVNANARVGQNAIVNTGAIVEHDCQVGDHVHLAPGSTLSGGVRVGTGAHIGVGATVRQGIEIGRRAIVGAGAVVVKDVRPDTTVVGVPAREWRRDYTIASKKAC